jgi:hypothetical protein
MPGALDGHVLALNYATLGIVDEILWLPSAAVAATAVSLLYGSRTELPERVLAQVGRGVPASVAPLLVESTPLAILLPSRLGPPGAWRAVAGDMREARALARQRYRELQTFFMTAGRAPSEGMDSLVRYTYSTRGRWFWSESAKRILDRVIVLNRAALALLVARSRGQSSASFEMLPTLPDRLPDHILDVLAEALPPIVVPDFRRLAECLIHVTPSLDGEESIERYQSLFAEMLSLAGHPGEVRG